ncbi:MULTISPECIES: hypothetical protein [Caballeronia]|uniref:hypothetical protein n=1 Tax=Caballeronia TaxID=1827195 RepID=UPI001EF40FCA|nr:MULTISPECIES: hypothetical protein [Caballeronia]MCG7400433.1 hypothetical protein [Caballeronia zhejiangensis]
MLIAQQPDPLSVTGDTNGGRRGGEAFAGVLQANFLVAERAGGVANASPWRLLFTLEFAVAMSARRADVYGMESSRDVKLQVAHIRTVDLSIDNVLASLPCGTPCSAEVRNGGR